jgi:hypothetical protein
MDAIKAGGLYFALTYAAGFVFGTARQLLLAPSIGGFNATLLEAPLMLIAITLAARWVIGWLSVPNTWSARLGMGLTAFTLLLAAEAATAGPFRGWTLDQWVGHFATPEGGLSMALFLLFAALPMVLLRRNPPLGPT